MATRCSAAAIGCALLMTATAAADAASRPSIAVVVYNQAAVAPATLGRATLEVARIVGDAGVEVTWIDPAAVESVNIFTIRLLIRPRAVGATAAVMGMAIGDRHDIGGSAFVFYDRVLASAHERHQDVAGVLAYAMAHEIGHLLLPAPAHADSGIMRPSWDGDDLRRIADGSMQFTPVQQAALRARAAACCALLLP